MRQSTHFSARDLLARCAAGVGLVVSAPLLVLAAVAILLEDGFPIFFRQTRIGLYGKPFVIFKLRSMALCDNPGPGITQGSDPRITAVGRVLRKYKIDELPQLLNILRGDMAFVGPRPEILKFVDLRDPLWRDILSVKPGITSEATLLFRNEEEMIAPQLDPEDYYRRYILPLKLKLHRKSLQNQSLLSSLKVILLTVRLAIFPAPLKRMPSNKAPARHRPRNDRDNASARTRGRNAGDHGQPGCLEKVSSSHAPPILGC